LKKYRIIYQEDNLIKKKIIYTSCIEEEDLPKNVLEIKKDIFDFSFNSSMKIKDKDIISSLYELSLMLNSKILLDDALEILIKNEKNSLKKEFFESLKNSFSNASDINKNIKKFKINPLIKSFFKITQDSGNPSSNIESLSRLISESYEIKKEFKKSMIYPMILFITFFLSLLGIFKFVVPNFESIFSKSSMELPLATKVLLGTKDIFENYSLFIFIGVFLFSAFIYLLYKNNNNIKLFFDKLLLENMFIVSDLYKLKNLYTYFVMVDILLKSRYEFLESITKSKVLLNNQYLFDKITQIENLLKSGKSVKHSFESVKLFDDITLNLINSGEISNSLATVVYEIKNIYKKRFDDKLKLFSLLIEPLFFIIIMGLIVWIILAIFVPLWSMSDMLQ